METAWPWVVPRGQGAGISLPLGKLESRVSQHFIGLGDQHYRVQYNSSRVLRWVLNRKNKNHPWSVHYELGSVNTICDPILRATL